MNEVQSDSEQTLRLLAGVQSGDGAALNALLKRHRPGMRSIVALHLNPRVLARIDPSDVVQEAQAEVVRRLDDFLARRPMPFHLWARRTAYERLLDLHRHHLLRGRRTVAAEVALLDHSSLLLAAPMLAAQTSPSQEAERRELASRVSAAIAELPDPDRDILLMRHAENLPFAEIACLLGIEAAAARKRFGRALIRLQAALGRAGLLGEEP
jgi:RNA polymerase sigma-70 factor (ECF subfamily)